MNCDLVPPTQSEHVNEIWKPIPGHDDRYEVSDHGRVRNMRTGLILSPCLSNYGYPAVRINPRPNRKYSHVHRLVLDAFVGPLPSQQETRHLDGVKTNNRLENLAYGTCRENKADGLRLGESCRGSRNGRAKLSEGDIQTMRLMRSSGSAYQAIADRFGVSTRAAYTAVTGKSWKHVSTSFTLAEDVNPELRG